MKENEEFRSRRKEVASFMKRLYRQGLTTTSGGNISVRIDEDKIAITPSATDKGNMKWSEVGLISLAGENLTPDLKPSIELEMHLSIYRKHSEVTAIVHAHPLFATSFTAMKGRIMTNLTAEACAILGEPRLVPYALMGTSELAEKVSEHVSSSDILLLENHGILTTGKSLLQAFDKMEVLENAARMTFITGMMGKRSPLSGARIAEIEKFFR